MALHLSFLRILMWNSGRPSSSYYFVGYQGDDLFYLDPHHSRCVVESKDLNNYTIEVNPAPPFHSLLLHQERAYLKILRLNNFIVNLNIFFFLVFSAFF